MLHKVIENATQKEYLNTQWAVNDGYSSKGDVINKLERTGHHFSAKDRTLPLEKTSQETAWAFASLVSAIEDLMNKCQR
jgi:ribonuclease HIII